MQASRPGICRVRQRQRGLAIEAFANSLCNPQLQRHLLAVDASDILSAVRACNEYLSIGMPLQTEVRQAEEGLDQVHTLTTQDRESLDNLAKGVRELARTVANLKQDKLEHRQGQDGDERLTGGKSSIICWGCRQEGHRRRSYSTHP